MYLVPIQNSLDRLKTIWTGPNRFELVQNRFRYIEGQGITGKPMSEALIFASTNPQYDDRLFIELQVQYIHENSKLKPGENMLCTEIVFDIQKNLCTQHVLPCSAKIRTSDKDLPV